MALATWSSKDSECWYALDLEATPAVQATEANPPYAFLTATQVPVGAGTAGVFYAKKSQSSANCSATYALTTNGFHWGTSYSNAPAN